MDYFKNSAALYGAALIIVLQGPAGATVPALQDSTVPLDANRELQVARSMALKDGSFVGGTYSAYYGPVQVQVTIKNGAIVSAKAVKFPNKSGTSRSINGRALPRLQKELIQAQDGRIDLVSGATLTSRAYVKSVRDALKLAAQ